MAALAGRTERLKFGMNVASLGLRDPVQTAKACATIDFLSDGRLLPAFGVGSARSKDFSASGTPTAGRGRRTSEGVQILSRLWGRGAGRFSRARFTNSAALALPRDLYNSPCLCGLAAVQKPPSSAPLSGPQVGKPASKPLRKLRPWCMPLRPGCKRLDAPSTTITTALGLRFALAEPTTQWSLPTVSSSRNYSANQPTASWLSAESKIS